MSLREAAQNNLKSWLEGPYDQETKAELNRLLQIDPNTVSDAFYTHLSFGTGGLRGLMGLGTNRINPYTIRAATQGVAHVLKKKFPKPIVVVGYDSRLHSRELAEETAKVFAANQCKVYFLKELRPSPLVSFAVRHLGCSAGIMITASHNPPEYNGFKVYWQDGAQVLFPLDKEILVAISEIDTPLKVRLVENLNHPLIEPIDLDQEYLAAIAELRLHPVHTDIKIVYTSLHGTGITLVPPALTQAGFEQVALVEEQVIPDGTFPTCQSPNPEDRRSLELGIKRMEEIGAQLLIATDPDADRMGAAVMHKGKPFILSGNQIATLCLFILLKVLTQREELPKNSICIKTIPTTELFRKIAESYGCRCVDVLIGFKHIAEAIRKWDLEQNPPHFLFAGEESFGYLLGSFTRDKDGITATVLLAEAAAFAKEMGGTLIDLLYALYQKYGYYLESLLTIDFPETEEGRKRMGEKMAHLQKTGIELPLAAVEDFSTSTRVDKITDKTSPLPFAKTDMMVFHLQDGARIVVRPSGTEPKIKIYCSVFDRQSSDHLVEKMEALSAYLRAYFN